jgi:hypothetical protein
MFRTPILSSTVTVQWKCPLGVERTADVVVEYTFDGHRCIHQCTDIVDDIEAWGIDQESLDALVDAAMAERAAEAYGDWLSGQDGSEY